MHGFGGFPWFFLNCLNFLRYSSFLCWKYLQIPSRIPKDLVTAMITVHHNCYFCALRTIPTSSTPSLGHKKQGNAFAYCISFFLRFFVSSSRSRRSVSTAGGRGLPAFLGLSSVVRSRAWSQDRLSVGSPIWSHRIHCTRATTTWIARVAMGLWEKGLAPALLADMSSTAVVIQQ